MNTATLISSPIKSLEKNIFTINTLVFKKKKNKPRCYEEGQIARVFLAN